MSDTIFTPGASVRWIGGRGGTVIDVRATPAGTFVIGVEVGDGEVRYWTAESLELIED